MKEATGELNMTVVTLIAVAAVAALFYFFLWPMVQRMVANQTCSTYGTNWTAKKVTTVDTGTQAEVNVWKCCPKDSENDDDCVAIDDDEEDNNGGGQTPATP